ncbi:DUF2732 family protein [Xenorhabdus nematophila]|uniref:DUF2732 family protein n=1 Tax=Xenorhabdus nematophila TaxID=628 RepID=UPI0032B86E3B
MENKHLISGYDPADAESRDCSVTVFSYEYVQQLIKDTRKAERQHCADLYAIRLVKLSAHVLDSKMGPSASAALLQSESENIERQAQEWNHV